MKLRSYPTVFGLGHRAISDLFSGPVLVESKVDGSAISFAVNDAGELSIRSKNAEINPDAPEGMFALAIEQIQARRDLLHPGYIYRGEYLRASKHNTLKYDRMPKGNIIIFDIDLADQDQVYLDWQHKHDEAERIGFECVPKLYEGVVDSVDQLKVFLDRESILGGTKVEGIVIKNYEVMTSEKKVAMGKWVNESFKEVHGDEWRKANPTKQDIVDSLIARYRTPARWDKAIFHLRDAGKLEGSPRYIGMLLKEIPEDILKECEGEIKDALFAHFWPAIRRGVIAGFPEFYKVKLAESTFNVKEDVCSEHITDDERPKA